MARAKTLSDVKAEFIGSSPEACKAWEDTGPRRALSAMLVEARTRHGMSQSDIATSTGWDKGYVSRLESATDSFPSVKTLAKYLSACGEKLALSTYREDAVGTRHMSGSVTFADPYDASAALQAAALAARRRGG